MQAWWIAALAASTVAAGAMGVAAHLLRRSTGELEGSLRRLEAVQTVRAVAEEFSGEGS